MLRIALLFFIAVAMTGCGMNAFRSPPPDPDEAAINALYERKEAAMVRYEEGLDALASGEREAADRRMDQAIAELTEAGSACAETLGCETQRFMAAYTNLLTLPNEVLIGAAEGYVEGDVLPEESDSPIIADLPAAARSINLLNGRELAEIIELNGPVKAALHAWLTWMRPTLIDTYEHYQFMRHLMWPVYEEAGLPEALLFGILAKESGGRVHSVSRAGAAGPLQFMYHTGRRFGLTRENGFDRRYDPTASTEANVAYLNERFAELNDNLELALAAYNGGEGRIQRLVRRNGEASFWDPQLFVQLPRETQEYVPYVLAAAWLFLHPEDYALEFPAIEQQSASVELASEMTLSEIAICVGQRGTRSGWFRTLRNLNPRHEADERLPAGSEVAMPESVIGLYEQHCIEGARAELATVLHEAHGNRRPPSFVYRVRSGDTLSTIASRHGCPSVAAIARENDIRAPRYVIRPGEQLRLTGCNR